MCDDVSCPQPAPLPCLTRACGEWQCAVAYSGEGKQECAFCRSPFPAGRELAERVRSLCAKGEPRAYYATLWAEQMTGDASLIPRIEVIQRRAALCKQGYSEALRG